MNFGGAFSMALLGQVLGSAESWESTKAYVRVEPDSEEPSHQGLVHRTLNMYSLGGWPRQ